MIDVMVLGLIGCILLILALVFRIQKLETLVHNIVVIHDDNMDEISAEVDVLEHRFVQFQEDLFDDLGVHDER